MDEKGSEGNGSNNKKDYHHVWWATSESNFERLYLPRREGGRGLVSIGDCINDKKENLALRGNEKLIIAATTEIKLKKFIYVQNRQERRKQNLIEKESSSWSVNERKRKH